MSRPGVHVVSPAVLTHRVSRDEKSAARLGGTSHNRRAQVTERTSADGPACTLRKRLSLDLDFAAHSEVAYPWRDRTLEHANDGDCFGKHFVPVSVSFGVSID